MMITKKALDRRTFLRGAGIAMSLPLLDSMIPAMRAARDTAANPAIRLGFVYVPNGIIQKDWVPATLGSNFEMTPTLKPLEPFRDKIVVLRNLAQRNGQALGDGGGDHARAGATWLTGVHPKKTDGADIHAGISADQIAARQLAEKTQFGSLEVGIEENTLAGGCDSGYSCAYTNTISWRGPSTPNPMELSPRALFERLFGDGESTDPAVRMKRMSQDRTILDFVSGDLTRLENTLGPGDKRKLEEYVEGIRDIERRISKAEEQSATMKMPVMERPAGIPDTFDEHTKLMSDLIVIAYQTDMTRVVTYMMAKEASNRSYREIGVPDGHHSLSHHMLDPDKMAKVQKIDEFHVKAFAYLVGRMQATPDGDGTLLDHSMLLYGSSIRDGNIHDHSDLPLVLAGGKSANIVGGRHIQYKPETPMTNFLLTMLDKVGVPADTLGDSTGKVELAGV
jgi:hypothetical protein